ncbi:hypothetical protein BJV77DRAFT_560332 [Russula vinacea]|nr:hypothetical protein BJV77DRAFT_560332 [Russula vinacea]
MPLSIINLPLELLFEITRKVSRKDLCQLRSVNSLFDTLATPEIFKSITVRNSNTESTEIFWTILHTPHIARHVQSIKFFEGGVVAGRQTRKRIEAAFSILHRIPHLKTLELYFEAHYVESPSYLSFLWDGKVTTHSHQWDIVYALGRNRNPLPELQSLIFSGWLHAPNFASFFDEAPIAWLTASLRHLSLSLPRGCLGADEWEARVQYWKQVAVRRVLRPAANLESLKITRHQSSEWPEEQCLDISQLPTYPRLAALSLKNIIWEEGTIGEGNVVTPFPLEDFIVHHSKTLKKLELRNCSILINKGFETPLSYWADIYKRLAEALTKLTELEVEFDIKRYKKPGSGTGCTGTCGIQGSRQEPGDGFYREAK